MQIDDMTWAKAQARSSCIPSHRGAATGSGAAHANAWHLSTVHIPELCRNLCLHNHAMVAGLVIAAGTAIQYPQVQPWFGSIDGWSAVV
jgi:hypothetical protein